MKKIKILFESNIYLKIYKNENLVEMKIET